MFDVLDAATVPQKLSQRQFAFHIQLAAQIVAVDHEKIDSASAGTFVIEPTVQGIEVGNPVQPDPDNLGVKNCGAFDMGRGIDNQRVAL